jgi:hypothetical protein
MREKKKIELLICRFGVDEKRKTTLNPQLIRMEILQKVRHKKLREL